MKKILNVMGLKIVIICLSILGFVFIFQNCSRSEFGVSGDKGLIIKKKEIESAISYYKSETTGGGDFGYEIKDNGSHFLIQLNHYNFTNFSPNQKTILINKTVDPNLGLRLEGEMDILNLMSGVCKYQVSEQNSCPECLTGTWSSQYISTPQNKNPIQIYGLDSCTAQVDEGKIRSFIINSLNL